MINHAEKSTNADLNATATGALTVARNSHLWDEQLLRSVAVLEAKCFLLDDQADILTDLSDMQAHRRIKSELADYISAHAKAGTIPSAPLAELRPLLGKLSKFFSKAEETHQRFFVQDIPIPSLSKIREAQSHLEETANQLPSCLQAIAADLSPLDWDGVDDNADIHPELLICAQVIEIGLPDTAELRRSCRLLALGKGPFYQGLQFQFQKVRESLLLLIEIHARHRETLTQIAETISLGNHRTAGTIMLNGGIDPNSPVNFKDLDYSPAKKTAELEIAANSAVAIADATKDECTAKLQSFEKVAGTSQQTLELNNIKVSLTTTRNNLGSLWNTTTSIPGSELEQECRPHLEAAYQWLDWAEAELDAKAAKGTGKRQLKIFAVCAAALLVLVAISFSISARRKHNAILAAQQNALALAKAAELLKQAPSGMVECGSFYIDRHDVYMNRNMWDEVVGWANRNGYRIRNRTDMGNMHLGRQDYYEFIKFCNARSQMEGRTPVYYEEGTALKKIIKSGSWMDSYSNELPVEFDGQAKGYRLPTSAELNQAWNLFFQNEIDKPYPLREWKVEHLQQYPYKGECQENTYCVIDSGKTL